MEQIKARALEIARKSRNFSRSRGYSHSEHFPDQAVGKRNRSQDGPEQEAQKAQYFQQRAQIDADTAVIQAKGEAESIRIRGQALKDNPAFVDLKIVDKWDGTTPLVIGGRDNLVYQLQDLERLGQVKHIAVPTQNSTDANARQ